jgi:hypothetical protein
MNKRTLLIVSAWVLCIGTVFGFVVQQRQLVVLRARTASRTDTLEHPLPGIAETAPATPAGDSLSDSESRELLQLRSEVTKLTAKKRELANVEAEATDLRARSNLSQTNSASDIRLPPGYLRKSDAQLLGFSTPENTMQSFLWAVQHQDVTNLRRALTPELATTFGLDRPGERDKEVFKNLNTLPGMAVHGRQALPDGSVELQVELIPGLPIEKLHLGNIAGEWKLLEAF